MKTQKKYLAIVQKSATEFIKTIVYGYNLKEAIGWAAKIGIVVSCECIGEAIEEFEED